jgi:hypothetical protein
MKVHSKFIAFLLILIAFAGRSYGQQQSFVGNWLISQAKSSFGNVPFYTSVKQIQFKQDGDTVLIKSVSVNNANVADTSFSTYFIDGRSTEKLTNNKMKMKASMRWSDETHAFLRTAEYFSEDDSKPLLKLNEIWSLSRDGKELTITKAVRDEVNAQYSYTTTAVFDKQ